MIGRNKVRKLKRQTGFTLIELMVTVAIVAILAAISVPSFKDQIERSQTKSVMASFITGMAYARSEAVKIGAPVHLRSIGGSNDWSDGWCVTIKDDCRSDFVKTFKPAGSSSVVGNAVTTTKFTFNARGLLESSPGSVSLCPNAREGRKISVTLLGQALAQKCNCDGSGHCG